MHIVIVDGYSTGAALARQLHAPGVPCIHVQSQPQANEHPRRSFDAATYLADPGHGPDLQAVADRLTELGISRVTAGAESGVALAEQLSLHLGLPTNSAEHLAARRDKQLMGKAVAASGLATPRTNVARTPTAGRRWFEASGLPEAVVKPLVSAGSDNVWFCRTAADVEAACASVLAAPAIFGGPNHAVLLQERLVGAEYYINTVSHDGHRRVAEIWRYTKQVSPVSTPSTTTKSRWRQPPRRRAPYGGLRSRYSTRSARGPRPPTPRSCSPPAAPC